MSEAQERALEKAQIDWNEEMRATRLHEAAEVLQEQKEREEFCDKENVGSDYYDHADPAEYHPSKHVEDEDEDDVPIVRSNVFIP